MVKDKMAKNKLTKGQRRQVQANHQRRLVSNVVPEQDDSLFAESQSGRVISRFGLQADVLAQEGQVYRCHIRRTVDSLVTGDRVSWRAAKNRPTETVGIIEAVYERQSVLTRPDYYDGIKPIAANIDQVVIVSSVLPALSLNIIDRYLVACASLDIEPLLVVNKIDLLNAEDDAALRQQLALYSKLGYRLLWVSSVNQQGFNELRQVLNGRVSIFAGQSGVGKSSLLNALHVDSLLPIATNTVSAVSGLGQHTTTAARLYFLPDGGEVIDSPGVREFGLWHLDIQQVVRGFIEFAPYVAQCKFRDCSHNNDPGCALRAALERGEIAHSRFTNYHRILDSITSVKNRRDFS